MWDVKRKSCNHLWYYTLNANCLVCARDSLEARVADLEKQHAAAQSLVAQLTEEQCCACEDAIAVMRDVDLDLETPAAGLRYLIKRSAQPAPAGLSEWLISRIDAARSEAAADAFADVLEHVTCKAAPAERDAEPEITRWHRGGDRMIRAADGQWVEYIAHTVAVERAAALARPQSAQEPAAWLVTHQGDGTSNAYTLGEREYADEAARDWESTVEPLYRAPPQAAGDAELLREIIACDARVLIDADLMARIQSRLHGAQGPAAQDAELTKLLRDVLQLMQDVVPVLKQARQPLFHIGVSDMIQVMEQQIESIQTRLQGAPVCDPQEHETEESLAACPICRPAASAPEIGQEPQS